MSSELLAAIHAAPDDDEARRVYADALIERGDPRGELIVLQLRRAAGDASERENELERALLKRYASGWLGPIAHLVDASGGLSSAWARSRTRFERGFLATAFLKLMTSPPLADDPIWHTCEELRGYLRPHLDMLVKLPLRALRRLRVTDTFTADDLAQLARRTTPLAVDRVPIFAAGTPLPSVGHVFPDAEAQFSARRRVARRRRRARGVRPAARAAVDVGAQHGADRDAVSGATREVRTRRPRGLSRPVQHRGDRARARASTVATASCCPAARR